MLYTSTSLVLCNFIYILSNYQVITQFIFEWDFKCFHIQMRYFTRNKNVSIDGLYILLLKYKKSFINISINPRCYYTRMNIREILKMFDVK